MDRDSVQARLEHECAELHASFPQLSECRTALSQWLESGALHYALRLDLRWPQHQTLLSGAPAPDPGTAIAAAFEAARSRIEAAPRPATPAPQEPDHARQ